MTTISCQKPTEEENLVGTTYINQFSMSAGDVQRTLVFTSETELTIYVKISGISTANSSYTFTLDGNILVIVADYDNKTRRWTFSDDKSILTTHDNFVYNRQ